MPLNREKEICSQSRGFLQATICLLEITTLTISRQQRRHIVKKGECGSEREDGKRLVVVFSSIHSHFIKQSVTLKFKNNISLVTRKIGGYMSQGQRA